MKWKLLTAAALLAFGSGVAKADSLSISVGLPATHVYYDNYEPRRVYRETHYYPAPRVVYREPRVVYRDVHYYDRDRYDDRRYDDRGRGRGHHKHHHHHH